MSSTPAKTEPVPDPTEAALGRARQAAQAKRWHEAIGICQDVLAGTPEHPAALALLGTVHAQRGEVDPGIVMLERAIAAQANVAGWHANLCALYRLACRPQEAVRAGQTAVRLQSSSPQYLINLALALTDLDERQQATACLLRALGLDPKEASAHLALGQILLAQGEMQPGWIEYEWRNETEAAKGTLPRITSALWNGMPLQGRLLLVGDQGYGDTIQFARYIPLASKLCQELIIGCSPELVPLISKIPGITSCHHRWDEIPGHAAHARLSSLPYLFRTEIATIPSPDPYLSADPARVAFWRERLDAELGSGGKRVGLAWSGRPTHPNDRRRSIRLATLRSLADVPNVSFVSLQRPMPAADMPLLGAFRGLRDHADDLADFGETAAVVANLDLVITVDTAVGHLTGSLGRPAWILTPRPSDWRWMLNRSDSPWYPSVRLFRQPAPGMWEEPVREVTAALYEYAASPIPVIA
jgi:Tfp pilus assembly protein PilF